MGKVPAVLIDGEPLFEAATICTYLARLKERPYCTLQRIM